MTEGFDGGGNNGLRVSKSRRSAFTRVRWARYPRRLPTAHESAGVDGSLSSCKAEIVTRMGHYGRSHGPLGWTAEVDRTTLPRILDSTLQFGPIRLR
jgi:hypothetical protein